MAMRAFSNLNSSLFQLPVVAWLLVICVPPSQLAVGQILGTPSALPAEVANSPLPVALPATGSATAPASLAPKETMPPMCPNSQNS